MDSASSINIEKTNTNSDVVDTTDAAEASAIITSKLVSSAEAPATTSESAAPAEAPSKSVSSAEASATTNKSASFTEGISISDYETDSSEEGDSDSQYLHLTQSESEVDDGDEEDEELPPMLEPPSGLLIKTDNDNAPPPLLEPVDAENQPEPPKMVDPEEIWLSDEGQSTTDSDDDLVKVSYRKRPPQRFKNIVTRYKAFFEYTNWVYNLKSAYKKSPCRARKLMKIHKDSIGNPVRQSPGIFFEKFHAERERIKKYQNIKVEDDSEEEKKEEHSSVEVVSVKIASSDPRLVHVAYPANVVNNDKVISTMGGIKNISNIFEQPNKKLHARFRPNDPFANGVNATGRTACGLLLRVRRRKNPEPIRESRKINLDLLEGEPMQVEHIHDLLLENQILMYCHDQDKFGDNVVKINGKEYREPNVVMENKFIEEKREKQMRLKKAWGPGPLAAVAKEFNLQVPETFEVKNRVNIKVDALGIIHRSYEFNSLCDFQYLPVVRNAKGNDESIKDKVFPILGSEDNIEKLISNDIVHNDSHSQPFVLPPAMSRIDNPPKSLVDDFFNTDKDKVDDTAKKPPPDDAIFSSRIKRIIYTISFNFQTEGDRHKSEHIPTTPLEMAVNDIERRQIKKELVDCVGKKFDERPIWSKAALAFATKIPAGTLKYIIPFFSYFAANGPWRNTWIKFCVDPRKCQKNVVYQSVDFRVPFIYRSFMGTGPKNAESLHKYLPEHMPPKTQMFYQLCDIQLDEVNELLETINQKVEAGSLIYEERHGFLKEGTYEYFRYILTYHVENLLIKYDKIPESAHSEPNISIPFGEIEPSSKIKAAPHRRLKVKRIRRSTKKASNPQSFTTTAGRGRGKKSAPVRNVQKSKLHQQTLDELILNDLPFKMGLADEDLSEQDEEYLDE